MRDESFFCNEYVGNADSFVSQTPLMKKLQ